MVQSSEREFDTVEIAAEDPSSDDAAFCLRAYFDELDERFAGGFDPGETNPAHLPDLSGPTALLLLARRRGEPVGCGALKLIDPTTAYIKRMWVAASARGLGVGRRLLVELEGRARDRGAATVCLETNKALTEAIAMYRGAGYTEVEAFNDERYAHHWFEKKIAG